MKTPNYSCVQCGVEGYKSPSKIKQYVNNFCSVACRMNFQRNHQTNNYTCAHCGKEGYKSPSHISSSINFCNRTCRNEYQANSRCPNFTCTQCGKTGYRRPSDFKYRTNYFCSKKCKDDFATKQVEVICLICKKAFYKTLCASKLKPRHCCSKECFKTLAKFYKNWGSSRSKLEIETEIVLKNKYSFEILFNETVIGHELDIDIPCLDLAFEINGPTHKKPIYGEETLLRTIKKDKEKVDECKRINKHLVVLDVSDDNHNKKTRQKRILEILEIINNKMIEKNLVETIEKVIDN